MTANASDARSASGAENDSESGDRPPLDSHAPQWLARAVPEATTLDPRVLERLANELGEGGRETLVMLIGDFLIEFPQVLERLQTFVQTGDWGRVAFEAHRARSSTGNLAARQLAAACEALEECGVRADAARAPELMQQLRSEFERARVALERWSQPRASTEEHGTATNRERSRAPG